MPDELIVIENPSTLTTVEIAVSENSNEILIENDTIETEILVENDEPDSEIEITDKAPMAVEFIFNQQPAGLVDGSNATYTTPNEFRPDSLVVRLNGIAQTIIEDYLVLNTHTISLAASPLPGERVRVDYIKL
jgi:hypothetical protein